MLSRGFFPLSDSTFVHYIELLIDVLVFYINVQIILTRNQLRSCSNTLYLFYVLHSLLNSTKKLIVRKSVQKITVLYIMFGFIINMPFVHVHVEVISILYLFFVRQIYIICLSFCVCNTKSESQTKLDVIRNIGK